jgi:signal transduction histidine kinase/CheY-like chemotaxis protein/HAMP domain-containing protein
MAKDNRAPARARRGPRLRSMLLRTVTLLVVVPLIALAVVPALLSARQERADQVDRLNATADQEAAELNHWIAESGTALRDATTSPVLRPMAVDLLTGGAEENAATRAEFTVILQSLHLPFDRVLLVDAKGIVRGGSNPSLFDSDVSAEPWFDAAMAAPGDGFAFEGPLTDPVDGQESLFFAVPLYNDQRSFLGVLAGRTSTDPLAAILSSIPAWGQTADAYLVRGGGDYVLPPRLEAAPNTTVDEFTSPPAGVDGYGIWRDYRGQMVIGAYRWIAPLNAALVVKLDRAEALAGSTTLLRNLAMIGAALALLAVVLSQVAFRHLIDRLQAMVGAVSRMADGNFDARLPQARIAEVSQASSAIERLGGYIRDLQRMREEAVRARTRVLTITARMGHVIASETNLDSLLQLAVDLIRDWLEYYHAQVFLLDDVGQHAVLRTSMGAAGRRMLAQGHKLEVGSRSVVGQAAARAEPVLASNTARAEYWRPNPLLPDTQSELAIPLQMGGQVIGVLDIQATEPDVFDDGTIAVLSTLADQLAVAIRNAELIEEQKNLLEASEEMARTLTREGWAEFAEQRRKPRGAGFRYDLAHVEPVDDPREVDGDVRLPIALRGAVIGELTAQLDPGRRLTEDETQLVEQVLERTALAIDNARLIEQTQLSLRETNRLYQATRSITTAGSVDELAGEIVRLTLTDAVDRAMLVMLENPSRAPGGRRVRVRGMWLRDANDPLAPLPEQILTGEHPLVSHVENIPVGDFVANDLPNTPLEEEMKRTLLELGVQAVAVYAIVPTITGQETLGWLILHSTHEPDAFSEEDRRYYEALVDQGATALEGLRLYEQTEARARRLQATNEVSRAASSILDPDILLPLVVERVSEAFGYYHSQIFLVDQTGEWAMLRASTGEVGAELLRRGHRLAVGSRSVIGQVTVTGEPIIARDTDADPVHRRNELLPDTRAEMAIPLRTGDRVIGALDVQSTEPQAFDREAQAILQSLADQIAVTLENAQLFREIQDRVGELTTVNRVSQRVSRTQTLDELYDIVTEQLIEQLDAQHGFLGVLALDGTIHRPVFIEDGEPVESPPPAPLGQDLSSYVIRTGEVLVINENVEQEVGRLGLQIAGTPPESLIIAPLALGDEVIGVIGLQDTEREFAYDEAHVRQLTTLAAYIAVKLRNAELLDEAQRRADELGFLFDVTRTAVASTDLDEALAGVGDVLLDELRQAEAVTFYLADPEAGDFEARAAVGYGRDAVARGVRVRPGEGLVGRAAARHRSVRVDDAQEVAYAVNGGGRTRSAIAIPLISGLETVGVLAVESATPGAFDKNDLRLLEGASGTLTAVIQNARLLAQITETNIQLRELDTLKSQFLANMSHELRTPLNSIIGFSRVMIKGIDGPLTDLQEQDLTTIYNSGQHLLSLINNILDLSKIEAGKMEIQPEYMTLDEIVDAVIATGRGLVKDKPIELVTEVEDDLPQVYGDAVRVRQVLLNLMSNAAKFTEEGRVTLRVARKPYDRTTDEPPRVQLDVTDTGIGIRPEDMSKLFQAFSQVDGSTTRQAGGTGLGLAISKQFVEMMGGRIWVESEPDEGTTFSFTVPLHPPDAGAPQAIVEAGMGADRPVVLAVDDAPGVLDLYARYLEEAGYGFVGVGSAEDIVGQVRRVEPAVVLLDLNLPGMSGWDAVDQLKEAGDTRRVPIVIASIDEDRPRAREAGVDGYLVKPVLEEELLAEVSRAIAGAAARVQDVLIVDADAGFAGEIGAALESRFGCLVRACQTGLSGLETLYEQPPDVLVLDVDLPDMDGYGLLVSLRSREELADLPVVIFSARELTRDDLTQVNGSATCYVPKIGRSSAEAVAELAAAFAVVGA